MRIDPARLHPVAQSYAKAAKQWMARDDEPAFSWKRPREKLQSFVDGDGKPPRSEFTRISNFLATQFLAALLNGEPASAQGLLHTVKCRSIDRRLDAARKLRAASATDAAIALGLCWTVGWLDEAEVLALEVERLAEANRLMYGDHGSVDAFMMTLWSERTGRPWSDPRGRPLVPAYARLAEAVGEPDPSRFSAACAMAAEFHVSRSREHTDDETYEFCNEFDRVFPSEILTVLTIRRQSGFAMPSSLDHALLSVAWDVFKALPAIELDPLIAAVHAKLVQELPGFV